MKDQNTVDLTDLFQIDLAEMNTGNIPRVVEMPEAEEAVETPEEEAVHTEEDSTSEEETATEAEEAPTEEAKKEGVVERYGDLEKDLSNLYGKLLESKKYAYESDKQLQALVEKLSIAEGIIKQQEHKINTLERSVLNTAKTDKLTQIISQQLKTMIDALTKQVEVSREEYQWQMDQAKQKPASELEDECKKLTFDLEASEQELHMAQVSIREGEEKLAQVLNEKNTLKKELTEAREQIEGLKSDNIFNVSSIVSELEHTLSSTGTFGAKKAFRQTIDGIKDKLAVLSSNTED